MEINGVGSNPAFGMRFVKNGNFEDVVRYAKDNNLLKPLDNALNTLLTANKGDVLLIHNKNADGRVCSSFYLNGKSVQNLGAATPEEASYNAILDLAQLGRKFRSLVCGTPKENITAEQIINKYTV